jgi:hypothetical protein
MPHIKINKREVMIVFGALSLLALLSYTWVHTGGLLSTYVNPGWIGYVAAFGIESAIVGFSLRIGELKKLGQNYWFFLTALILVMVVSAIANISQGFYVKYGEYLSVNNWQKMDLVEAGILIAATGLISVVTLAISEVVGQDVVVAQKDAAKEERRSQKPQDDALPAGYKIVPPAQLPAPQEPEDKPEAKVLSDEEFTRKMDELGTSAPQSVGAVELMFGLSHATAQRRLSNYRKAR